MLLKNCDFLSVQENESAYYVKDHSIQRILTACFLLCSGAYLQLLIEKGLILEFLVFKTGNGAKHLTSKITSDKYFIGLSKLILIGKVTASKI